MLPSLAGAFAGRDVRGAVVEPDLGKPQSVVVVQPVLVLERVVEDRDPDLEGLEDAGRRLDRDTSNTIVSRGAVTLVNDDLPDLRVRMSAPTCSIEQNAPVSSSIAFSMRFVSLLPIRPPNELSSTSAQVVIVAQPPGFPSGRMNTEYSDSTSASPGSPTMNASRPGLGSWNEAQPSVPLASRTA